MKPGSIITRKGNTPNKCRFYVRAKRRGGWVHCNVITPEFGVIEQPTLRKFRAREMEVVG